MIRIKRLTTEEYDKIVSVWERGGMQYDKDGRDSKECITRQITNHGGVFLGAFDRGDLIGVILATYDGRRGWLNRLCIDPAYRRRGIAKRLIRESERVLRKKGAKVIAALVEEENTPSMMLCESLGYTPRKDIIYFRKKLD